jgi:EAL domain-containing protein (putative c-di-GMP-specific phosphodiesterase class I)/FixJ family two-component response regulator
MNWATHTALVVEDSAVQRLHAVELLKTFGFGAILEADNGRHALRVLELHGGAPVQLVMTDLDMPEMDGIELIRQLAARRMTQNLVVTSARDPRLFEIVERMATDDGYVHLLGTLSKPVKMDELASLLDQVEPEARPARAQGIKAPVSLAGIGEIEDAIRSRQFVPFFQPKVSMKTGAIKGVEALARWRHPEFGLLGPDRFIPVIEGRPAMAEFTLLIAEETLKHLATLHRRGLASLTASVNLSACNLADRGFIDTLAGLVDAYGIPSNLLIWEVTETMVMENVADSLVNLARLGLKGFGLAMDDYGIGYSSIQQFSRCPFTELKIDRGFVRDAARRPNRRAILESAIEMGHRLDVATVAEGIETRADWDLLRTLGCDLAQGFLIARPMPIDDLQTWVKTHRLALKPLVEEEEARPEGAERRGTPPIKLVVGGGQRNS